MSIAYMILDFRKTQTILEIKESTETQFNVPFVPLDITNQGMNYYTKFIILYKDCLVMKIIDKWPITKVDTNFSKISTKN